jgi:hypothetical protein
MILMFDILHLILCIIRSRGSVWLRTGRPGFDPQQRQRIFLLASASRPALGITQPPVQWVPGVLSPGAKRGRDVIVTTHSHLVPKLSMSRSYTSSPCRLYRGIILPLCIITMYINRLQGPQLIDYMCAPFLHECQLKKFKTLSWPQTKL